METQDTRLRAIKQKAAGVVSGVQQQEFLRIGRELEVQYKVVQDLSQEQEQARELTEKASAAIEKCDTRIDELNQQLRNPGPSPNRSGRNLRKRSRGTRAE